MAQWAEKRDESALSCQMNVVEKGEEDKRQLCLSPSHAYPFRTPFVLEHIFYSLGIDSKALIVFEFH